MVVDRLQYQYLKTLSRDPSNTVVGVVRTPEPTKAKVADDNLSNVHIIHGDLTDSASLFAAAKEVSTIANGTVDFLVVNGAYLGGPTFALKASEYVGAEKEALLLSELSISMHTNAVGPLYAANAFMPLLLKSQVKKVIFISSGGADIDLTIGAKLNSQVPYSFSKAALNILAAKFALEYREQGVKFLSLAPGYVLTIGKSVDDRESEFYVHCCRRSYANIRREVPPEWAAAFHGFTDGFRNVNPDLEGPVSPEEAVAMHLKVIENLTLEQSGQFLSQFGNKTWI